VSFLPFMVLSWKCISSTWPPSPTTPLSLVLTIKKWKAFYLENEVLFCLDLFLQSRALPEIPYLSLNPMDNNTPKFGTNRSTMKGTLLEEHDSFLTVNLLPFRGLYWNPISCTQPPWPTTFERLVSIGQWRRALYIKDKVPSLMNLFFLPWGFP